MKHIIVGTAGHIDHGKTALVKALTGTDPDRLKEEQQRGITIDIGFAFLKLSDDIEAGIIDVPGHEKFVKNMLAGIGGIDVAILVIASDEGIMPQTEEHLAICDLLQIQRGLVALTKIDLVDAEWLEMVTDDIRESLTGTFLEHAPIVPVSSKTGEGLNGLLEELARLAAQVQERSADGVFRLPIDRVFTIKGFGTVVTGTLISGSIRTDDTVEILPQQVTARVRNVQIHDQPVEMASAGQRTALNLHGVEKTSIQRGDILTEPNLLKPTYMLDAYLSLVANADKPMKDRSRVRFHHGTSEVLGRVVMFDREELLPGESASVQIRLESPIIAMARDRYILRNYSPVVTIGGGEILYVHPEKHKRTPQVMERLRSLREGTLEDVIAVYVEYAGFTPITSRAISGMLAVSETQIAAALDALIQKKRVINTASQGVAVIAATHYQQIVAQLLGMLDEFHKKFPLKSGMPKEELRTKLPSDLPLPVFQHILDRQVAAGAIQVEQTVVRKTSYRLQLSAGQQKIKQQIENAYLTAQFQPANHKEVLKTLSVPEKESEPVFRLLVEEGTLIRVEEEIYYHKNVLADIKQRILAYFTQHHEIGIGEVRDLLQISRKYTVPIMTYLDASGVTMRKGDVRVLRS